MCYYRLKPPQNNRFFSIHIKHDEQMLGKSYGIWVTYMWGVGWRRFAKSVQKWQSNPRHNWQFLHPSIRQNQATFDKLKPLFGKIIQEISQEHARYWWTHMGAKVSWTASGSDWNPHWTVGFSIKHDDRIHQRIIVKGNEQDFSLHYWVCINMMEFIRGW